MSVDSSAVLLNFEPDPNVIINKNYLKYVIHINYKDETHVPSNFNEWHPRCNSYYSYTEDVDAENRVDHLLAAKQFQTSFVSLTHSGDIIPDAYTEEEAQVKYLTSDPVCYIILGKPGLGEKELGKLMSQHLGCVYVEPEDLIKEEMHSNSRAGQCIEFNLRRGKAIGSEVILRLAKERILSQDARHRGCVVCGFPLIHNDMYEEEAVSSESTVFTTQEIFDEILETVDPQAIKNVSRVSESLKSDGISDNEDKPNDHELWSSYVEDVETESRDHCLTERNFEQQLIFLLSLIHCPLFLIYIACDNKDVIIKRENYGFDVIGEHMVNMQYGNVREDFLTESFHKQLSDEQRFKNMYPVRLPENFPVNIRSQLAKYHFEVLPTIEKLVLLQDPQMFLKLDGRLMVISMFDILRTRLRLSISQQVSVPENFISNFGMIAEDEETPNYETNSKVIDKLRRQQIIHRTCKWSLSKWGTYCPVALKNGRYIEGHPEFAMGFMNQIFFLSSHDSIDTFRTNPRSYLLPLPPKPLCKIYLLGPKASGKTAVATSVALLFNGSVLSTDVLIQNFLKVKEKKFIEAVRTKAINEAIILLTKTKQEIYEVAESKRKVLCMEWIAESKRLIQERLLLARLMELNASPTLTHFPLMTASISYLQPHISESDSDHRILRNKFNKHNLDIFSDLHTCKELDITPETLEEYLPDNLKNPTATPTPVDVVDPFVHEYANKAVLDANFSCMMTLDDYVEMYTSAIEDIENKRIANGECCGGWIVDGLVPNLELVVKLFELNPPEDVIILRDSNMDFLIDNYNTKDHSEFRNFKKFFENINRPDIAARSPSLTSTSSHKNRFAKTLISDIIRYDRLFEDKTEAKIEQENEVNLSYETTEELVSKEMKDYKKDIKIFEDNIENIIDHINQKNGNIVNIVITNKSVTDVMKEVIEIIDHKLELRAHITTLDEQNQEIEDFGRDTEVFGEDAGRTEYSTSTDEIFSKNRRLGDTTIYCPVTYKNSGVLWKGKNTYACSYNDKIFLFPNETTRTEFLVHPWKYTLHNPPTLIPPPRLCIVGPSCSGKTILAKGLSKELGLYYVSYEQCLRNIRIEHSNSDTSLSIQNYLLKGECLPEHIVSDLNMERFWFEEPTLLCGFALDDFPKKPIDVEYIVKHLTIPDIVVELFSNGMDIIERQVQNSIVKWEADIKKAIEDYENVKANKLFDWANRRNERISELCEIKKRERYKLSDRDHSDGSNEGHISDRSEISYNSVEDEADLENIVKIVDTELPEPEFNDNWENIEEARARIREEKLKILTNDIENYRILKELCEDKGINWVRIESNVPVENVLIQALKYVNEVKFRNGSFFERCYDVKMDVADELIKKNYYFLSKFGRTCPVQLYEKNNPFNMFLMIEKNKQLYPIIHKNYIYYLNRKPNRDKFIDDPLKYVNQQAKFSFVQFRFAIIGAPKSGKSVLAKRFESDLGFKYISIGQAVRYVLNSLPNSNLARSMVEILNIGRSLTIEMTMKCVEAFSFEARGLFQGLIFDGFPNCEDSTRYLAQLGLLPQLIIDLQATKSDIEQFLSEDKGEGNFPTFSKNFIFHRYENWSQNSRRFRNWIAREYQNVVEISVKNSKWKIWDTALKLVTLTAEDIRTYYSNAHNDVVLSLMGMQISPRECLQRMGTYKYFCPCCLYYNFALVNGGNPPDRTGVVQYRDNFYWVCRHHRNEFIVSPQKFLPPNNKHTLPTNLPTRITLIDKPDDCYENGLCIVCFWENQPRRVIQPGSVFLACSYIGKIYLFDSDACLEKFKMFPEKYFNKIIHFKPSGSPELNLQSLPILGYLEQSIAGNIVMAVVNTGIMRPVILGLSIETSALLNIAFHFKVNNSRTPKELIPMYENSWKTFKKRKQEFIDFMKSMKSVINPHIYYVEPFTICKREASKI